MKKMSKTVRRKKRDEDELNNLASDLVDAKNELWRCKGVLKAERAEHKSALKRQSEERSDFEKQRDEWGKQLNLACKTAKDFFEKLERAQAEDSLNISVLLQEIARLREKVAVARK